MAGKIDIKLQPVESSTISAVGYSEEKNVLQVQFNGGGVYQYYAVQKRRFDGLLKAKSKGEYFHKHIKLAGYKYRQLAGGEEKEREELIVATPVYLALLQTRRDIREGSTFPYCLWINCGRENTAHNKNTKYQQALDIMKTASGKIGPEHIDAAIRLAKQLRR